MMINLVGCGLIASGPDNKDNDSSNLEDQPLSVQDEDASTNASGTQDGLTPVYDNKKILEAWRSDDTSGLDEKETAIYTAAKKAISEFYTDDMDDTEAVIKAHDWIVTHVTYDPGELLAIPRRSEDSESPYGALVNGEAICMGYTTTFQLFMDMLGIDSQIIHAMADNEEHAWNLVKLGDNYYHVDTTWDDFIPDEEGRIPFHMYLLVTDSAMEVLHVWDHTAFPSASDDSLNYYTNHGLFAKTHEDIEAAQHEAKENGWSFCEVMSKSDILAFTNGANSYWQIDMGDYFITIYWI